VEINLAFRISFLLLWFLYLLSRLFPSRGLPSLDRSRGERRAALREEGLYIIFTLFMAWYGNIIAAILYLLDFPWMAWSYIGLPFELRIFGILFAMLLVPYTYWIGRTIAQNFSFTIEVQDEQQLITTGPYGRVRHPIYSSAIFFLASLVLVTDNWIFLVVLLLIIPGLNIRMKKEEQMMLTEFGDQYRVYMTQTGRFLPKIRR
jgi:protein-S-isoprenylcysteine O-methyltransferase Ste14